MLTDRDDLLLQYITRQPDPKALQQLTEVVEGSLIALGGMVNEAAVYGGHALAAITNQYGNYRRPSISRSDGGVRLWPATDLSGRTQLV